MTHLVSAAWHLLHSEGKAVDGFDGGIDAAEAEAILRYSCRPYCLVRNWIILEVAVPEEHRISLAADGLIPYVLYASNVLLHSAHKRTPGDWVRSTYARSIVDEYVFETRNTTYLLVGPGSRKRASVQVVMAIAG